MCIAKGSEALGHLTKTHWDHQELMACTFGTCSKVFYSTLLAKLQQYNSRHRIQGLKVNKAPNRLGSSVFVYAVPV